MPSWSKKYRLALQDPREFMGRRKQETMRALPTAVRRGYPTLCVSCVQRVVRRSTMMVQFGCSMGKVHDTNGCGKTLSRSRGHQRYQSCITCQSRAGERWALLTRICACPLAIARLVSDYGPSSFPRNSLLYFVSRLLWP